jgi:RNA polymerase sigma factor (sigma-70 family)
MAYNRRNVITQLELDDIGNLLKELVSLRRKCKESDDENLHKRFDTLHQVCVQKLDFLVDARTRKYRNFSNYEDLKQDGRVAMILGLKSYDPEKGDFLWWLNKYIKTRISREANRHSTIKIPIKHTARIQPYKVNQLPIIIDKDPSPCESMENNQEQIMVRTAVFSLPEKQRNIIQLHFALNESTDKVSIKTICDTLKMDKVDCVRLLNEAKRNLRQQLTELY